MLEILKFKKYYDFIKEIIYCHINGLDVLDSK